MAAKIFVLACALTVANAGFLAAPAHYATPLALQGHAITSTSDNILRSPGNLAQVATQSKTIDTPYSSASKTDIRVSNPGVYAHAVPVAHAPISYAAPVAHAPVSYAAPVAHAPLGYAAPAAHGAGLLGVAYSPAVAVSHMSYSSPVGIAYSW